MHVFTTADWFSGNQSHLWPAVLSYIVFAITGMRRPEWRTARGGLALAILATFVIYLFVPETGFGGGTSESPYFRGGFLSGPPPAVPASKAPAIPVPLATLGLRYS